MNFWERDDDAYKNYNRQTQNDSSERVRTQNWASQNEILKDVINEYSSKSQDELMQELLRTASGLKRDGKLTAAELDDFYARVSLFLNDEQKERMKSLIELLKR